MKTFECFCSRMVMGIGLLILGGLSLGSLGYTEEFTANNGAEKLELIRHPLPETLGYLIVAIILLSLIANVVLKSEAHRAGNVKILLVLTCIYVSVTGMVWAVQCRYSMMWDGEMLSFLAQQFATGMKEIGAYHIDYMAAYTQQLGMISILEILYRIAGWENYHLFQLVNAAAMAGIVLVGYKIVREITESERAGVIYLLLMAGCWPLIIYVAVVYGELLSILFSLLSVYLLLRYIKGRQKRYAVGMAFAITAACLIRSNCYIVLAAMACVLLVRAVTEKKIQFLFTVVLCAGIYMLCHMGMIQFYEARLNTDLQHPMPSVMWIAMGTQEGKDGREAGWNNGFAWETFVDETGRNQELSTRKAKEVIEESVKNFKNNPSYLRDFYKRKIASQWIEPTYGCQVETSCHKEERNVWMERLYEEDLWKPFVRFMDVYQSVIYLGALLCLLLLIRKRVPVEQLILLITMIGGFLFYVFWEAKSRYVLPYFVMLIPYAAWGWDLFQQKIRSLWEKAGAGERIRTWASKLHPEKLECFCSRVVLLLAGLPSVFLFLYSLVFTTVYESNDLEVPSQVTDPTLLVILFVLLSLAGLWLAGQWILKQEANRKRNLRILLGVVLAHCAVFCIAWNLLAQSALRADPLYIHAIGGGFALSDLNESAMDYLYTYPHQAGQALLVELVYRLFGYENFLAVRLVNTLGVLVFVLSGFEITEELFHNDRTKVNFLLLAAGCIPLFVYTNVIYGEVLAIAAVSFGLWMFLRWLREEKGWELLLMILALVFAVYMKNNALIAAVAMVITAVVKALAGHRKKLAAWILPFLAVLLLAQPAMTKLYEQRSGWPLDQAMPKTLWVAMGLQGEGIRAGWWNEYPDKVYKEQAGYNPEEADAIAREAIAYSVKGFAQHPKAAVSFFGHKFVSQWNDASYGCEVSAGSQDTPKLEFWMNGYQSLILLGLCSFVIYGWKRRYRMEQCLPVLILLGGYLFHLVWEVKGRYGLFYFVLLLPAAAEGLSVLGSRLTEYMKHREKK